MQYAFMRSLCFFLYQSLGTIVTDRNVTRASCSFRKFLGSMCDMVCEKEALNLSLQGSSIL